MPNDSSKQKQKEAISKTLPHRNMKVVFLYVALHLWDMVKVVFKCTALNALNRKRKNVQTSEPNFQLRKPELKKKTKQIQQKQKKC